MDYYFKNIKNKAVYLLFPIFALIVFYFRSSCKLVFIKNR